jgi:hypothetical protein
LFCIPDSREKLKELVLEEASKKHVCTFESYFKVETSLCIVVVVVVVVVRADDRACCTVLETSTAANKPSAETGPRRACRTFFPREQQQPHQL